MNRDIDIEEVDVRHKSFTSGAGGQELRWAESVDLE